jgi:hypothetical protein
MREGKVWGLSECKCSKEELLGIVHRSLMDFGAEKPDAKLETLTLEMHVSKELWAEILAGVGGRLSTLEGGKASSLLDVPDEVEEETKAVLDRSATVWALKAILTEHGMSVEDVLIGEHLLFKDSLSGKKWSDIASLPGLGILVPGTVEFYIEESR